MTAKHALAMAAACVLLGGVLTRAWTQDAAPAPEAKQGEDALQTRWNGLRNEFALIATPLVEALEREERFRETESERHMQIRKAEIAYKNAKLAREVAEINLTEYVEGISKQETETALGEITNAQTLLRWSENHVDQSKRALEQIRTALEGKVLTAADIASRLTVQRTYEADQLGMERAKLAIEKAQTKQRIVRDFTQPQRKKELQADVEMKKSEELAREAEWGLAKAKRDQTRSALSPTERRLLVLLAEAARPGGVDPPTPQQPAELKAYLDKLEAKLAEARRLVEQVKEERLGKQFSEARARILHRAAESAK